MKAKEAIEYIEQHNHIDDVVKDMCIEMLAFKELLEEGAYIAILPKDGVYEINGIKVLEAVDKQTPMKVIEQRKIYNLWDSGKCPSCNRILHFNADCCYKCGQKLDWSNEDEEKEE